MGFSVYCYLPIIFSVDVKLANFLMFTVSEGIGRFFGQRSDPFVTLRKSSTAFGNRR